MSDQKNSRSPAYHKSTSPPSNRKVRNPFDKVLIHRLHVPLCSPGMCKMYKKKQTGIFQWDIDQASTLAPADIVACSKQFELSLDPDLERIADEATEKFFSQELVIPSPMEASKKVNPLHTSCDASIQSNSFFKETIVTRDFSAQTVLTLPLELPPGLEKHLQPFSTFTQDQDMSEEYEVTANGSLCRKLYFEKHSDMENYDSEQTDEEIQYVDHEPHHSFKTHTPIIFSPNLGQDFVAKGMTRAFGTPLMKCPTTNTVSEYQNKMLDIVDFGETCLSPIVYETQKCNNNKRESTISSSITSCSILPANKERNNFTSPMMENMATYLVCVASEPNHVKKNERLCKMTTNKIMLKCSDNQKESPPRSRKGSISAKRSRHEDMSTNASFHGNSQVSAQTVLTLPLELPPGLEKHLQPFFTFTQDQDMSEEYEVTANGSLCRKLYFEKHSDMENYDSEQTDEEIQYVDHEPHHSFKTHTPIIFSPNLGQDFVAKGMTRACGTPLMKCPTTNTVSEYQNKMLDILDFGETCLSPIVYETQKCNNNKRESTISSSITSCSILPANKERNNFTSPMMKNMATYLVCVASEPNHVKKNERLCKMTTNKIMLKCSDNQKESPPRSRKGSISAKRSRHEDMSTNASFHGNSQAEPECTAASDKDTCLFEDSIFHHLFKINPAHTENLQPDIVLDETFVRGMRKSSKIQNTLLSNTLQLFLDSSSDNALSLEDKKIDCDTVDLKFSTDNVSQLNDIANNVTRVGNDSTCFKRVVSGFTDYNFYGNASTYYQSATKPLKLTITNLIIIILLKSMGWESLAGSMIKAQMIVRSSILTWIKRKWPL